MMKLKMYPSHLSYTYLILSVLVALTLSEDVTYNGDIDIDGNLVKIYYNGKWGTICSGSTNVIKVVCRSLGLQYASSRSLSSSISSYMRSPICRGDENSIMDCHAFFSSYTRCSRYKLGARCQDDPNNVYCSFDNNICEMTIDGNDEYTWKRVQPSQSPQGNGLDKDHTTKSRFGKYMLAAGGLPLIDKTTLTTNSFRYNMKSLTFYYHMYGKDTGSLNVYIKSTNGIKTKMLSLKGSLDDEWKYVCISLSLKSGYHQMVFEAVRGTHAFNKIAIDDITISTKGCSNWNISCNFNRDSCGYDFAKDYYRRGWSIKRISGLIDRKTGGDYLAYESYYSHGSKSSVISPMADLPPFNTKVTFSYYMTGSELQVRFVDDGVKPQNTEAKYDWQDSGNHGDKWQYGCMNLPSKRGRIIITASAGNAIHRRMALDDITIENGTCQTGITNHVCTFDNPLLCEYTINCMDPTEFTWRRNSGSTSSSGTGPSTDQSNSRYGHYMYAEASYGKYNDTTELKFKVSKVQGKYLKFSYNMNGKEIGQLSVKLKMNGHNEKTLWTMKGDKGLYWHKQCLYIEKNFGKINKSDDGDGSLSFYAQRGPSFKGDIAIDTISIEEKPCAGPFDCEFETGLCHYKIGNGSLPWKIYKPYSYSSAPGSTFSPPGSTFSPLSPKSQNVYEAPGSTFSPLSPKGQNVYEDSQSYLYTYSRTYTEDMKFQLISPQAFVKQNSSITFKYQLRGYMKEFAVFNYNISQKNKIWSSNHNDTIEFTTACIDFPFSKNMNLIFQVTSDVRSYNKAFAYLDDIAISNETCKFGITYHFCKFKEVHFCNYEVECPKNTDYEWRRTSFSYFYEVPRPDNYFHKNTEYFMFANSENGRTSDKTHLIFRNVLPPAGHSFYFSYFIHENGGKLQLHTENVNGKTLLFDEIGISSRRWNTVCFNVTANMNTSFIFTATKGYEYNKHIALMDVGFKEGNCEDRSIACDFSNNMCQYQNHGYFKWQRIESGNESDSLNGNYMQFNTMHNQGILSSPSENITNSCVQIRYKMITKMCNLTIYNAYNDNRLLSTVNDDTTEWSIAQMYIQEEVTKLVFVMTNANYYYHSACTVLIDSVGIESDKCEELVCPAETRSCKNKFCYSESKLCDRIYDCSDGSDEENCSASISCDFKSKYYCGYNIVNEWKHIYHKRRFGGDVKGTIQLRHGEGTIVSPYEPLPYSCVKFKYITYAAVTGDLSVILFQQNSTEKWNEIFFNKLDGTYEGQFQIPAGNSMLSFRANIKSGILAIDDVIISNGTCPQLNCPEGTHMCSDNRKCIDEANVCNNYKNCLDGSDEMNCPKLLNCDFEDTNICGFESSPKTDSWILSTGISGERPKLDHSEKTYEGQYVISNSTEESSLAVPSITVDSTSCFNFFYTFFGDGNVTVYDNDILMMKLSKFDVDIWRNANVTLSKGVHNIRYIFSNKTLPGTVALDSVSVIPGSCLYIGCEENWSPCKGNKTCYAYNAKCDGIDNCPDGEDELNCNNKKSIYKLVGSRSLVSGKVQKLYFSDYLTLCGNINADEICSELGFNGTSFQRNKGVYIRKMNIYCRKYFRYSRCYKRDCASGCYCNSIYVYCSNTTCADGKVTCPPSRNGNSSSNATCIQKDSLCDGHFDCEGGTDEENCETCNDKQWQCNNKEMCINKDLRCDGMKDCEDGSDEFHCFTYKNNTIQVMFNGSYNYICQENLNDTTIANQLCSYVGRSNENSSHSVPGDGVQFDPFASNKDDQLISGFKINSLKKCDVMVLTCTKQECGKQKLSLIQPNIQGGQNALKKEWPWNVQILRGNSFVCAGVLIDNHHVLTSGYCVEYYSVSSYSVIVGSTQKYDGIKYMATSWQMYSTGSFMDITILFVQKEIMMSNSVQPACLPEHTVPKDKDCFITGWGGDETGTYQNTLQETKVYVLDNSYCKRYYPELENNTFCANNKGDYKPTCYGDSGGPLVCPNEQGNWAVYGIINSHTYCSGRISQPSVLINIYKLMHWIKRYI